MRAGLVVVSVTLGGCLLAGSDSPKTGPGDDMPPPPPPNCLDDRQFEPNDSLDNAFPTQVELQTTSFFAAAAICPANDVDHFAIEVLDQASVVEIVVSWADGPPLEMNVLDGSGFGVANGVPDPGFTHRTACLAEVPPGRYTAVVFSQGMESNYTLDINLVPGCSAP